jgi:hypothetical protein
MPENTGNLWPIMADGKIPLLGKYPVLSMAMVGVGNIGLIFFQKPLSELPRKLRAG